MSDQRTLRIGDAERDAAVAALGEHYAAGRLTKDEYDERAGTVWAARFGADLEPLFSDLPDARGAAEARPARTAEGEPSPSWPDRRRAFWMAPLMIMAFGGMLFLIVSQAPWMLFIFFWIWMCGGFGFRHMRRQHRPTVARFHRPRSH